MAEKNSKTPQELKKLKKPELIDLVLAMQRDHTILATELADATEHAETLDERRGAAVRESMTFEEALDKAMKRVREQNTDLRAETQRREDAFDTNRHLLVTNESLTRQLREEKKAHEKTRKRVKTAPRIRIDSNALLDVSKSGMGADSNLSEMFGDCDITVTEPEEEAPQPDEGIESFLRLLRRGPGVSRGSGEENPLGDMIAQTILSELRKGDEALCPICGVEDCPGTELMRGHAVAMDCKFDGPSHMCEHCKEYDCRFRGLSEETIKTMANDVDTFNIDGPFSLRDLIILQSGGKAMAMPFTGGRRRGPGL